MVHPPQLLSLDSICHKDHIVCILVKKLSITILEKASTQRARRREIGSNFITLHVNSDYANRGTPRSRVFHEEH